ncbi:DNA-binding response regulator [Nocardioides mangrovicus]|uniref:DNA-binding response regulator n=1 Tax=Nocardioides mangrovicus TaxID=2478913 RepID=A0A3L8P4S5_9ACTN|nr:response regulator transcription factor [Nocardioides mangrovicus]RLV50171.1 DNA-binding response regulator [Nocardioides mangrovicus]
MAITVSVLSEYELISAGVASVLARFPDQVSLVDDRSSEVDVAVWSTFGVLRLPDFDRLREQSRARRIAALCWDLEPEMVRRALEAGADGYLSTTLSGEELVEALSRIAAGETVVSPAPTSETPGEVLPDWPGQREGLSEREGDIVALIARGLSNDDVAGQLFLSINTVKSYIRSAYKKMGVASRSQAVLWAVDHRLQPTDRGPVPDQP